MTNIDIETVPVFYRNYVKQVMHMDVFEAMEHSRSELNQLISTITPDKENYAYAEGKWTVKELLCHIIDAERIFTYRALCFSRNDPNSLPGFDENAYVPESNATQRSLLSIRQELNNLRASTVDFFRSCNKEMLTRRGIANNTEISVLTLGYVVSGHAMHHVNILKQRYLA